MNKFRTISLYIKKLKGLEDVTIKFEKCLTAIMGVNGAGKTTVIHALACLYQPDPNGNGENHKFPEFFIPNTDAVWKGSELLLTHENEDKNKNRVILPSKKYGKDFDRWSPKYDTRPRRNVYYIGIDSCLPEIEKRNLVSRIGYSTIPKTDKISQKVLEKAAYVLNMDYNDLLDNVYNNTHFIGVKLKSGLQYSSLSMGTGEQRTIKILEKVYKAEPYSLILVDEIDLLLHISALRRIIRVLNNLAADRHLQIVFTTHSLEMTNLTDLVGIQFIDRNPIRSKTFIYSSVTSELIYSLTGESVHPLTVYVEDTLSKAVIMQLVKKFNMRSRVEIVTFGAIENGFTLAASFALTEVSPESTLIVLDGDRYTVEDEKRAQIKKKLTGTEIDCEQKQRLALSFITQFSLSPGTAPEKFFYDTIIKYFPKSSDLWQTASGIHSVGDSHEWLHTICERLSTSESDVISEIFQELPDNEELLTYTNNIEYWLKEKRNI